MQFLRTIGALSAATLLLGAEAGAQGPGGILPTPQDAPNRQGTRGANFLHLGLGARAGAMAGAVGATVSGPTAWYWNPGGAASTTGFSLAAGRQQLYGGLGLGQTYAAASIPLIGGVVGINLNTLSSGDIKRTSEANPFGERLGGNEFQWTSTAIGLGYARRLTDRLSVGAQLKYIGEGIPDASTSWFAGDVGTQFNTGLYGLVLGGTIQNIGGTARASGALIQRVVSSTDGSVFREDRRIDLFARQTELPVTFQLSIGSDLYGSANSLLGGAGGRNTVGLEVNVTESSDQSTQYALGAEYAFADRIYVRGGKRLHNDQRDRGTSKQVGLTGGFGVRFPVLGRSMRFDYSYEAAGALDNIQIFSFEVGR